jgi:hypothetical protein
MDWTNEFKVVSLCTVLEIQQRCPMNQFDYLYESTTRYYHHLSFPNPQTHLITQCNGSDVFGSDICTCRPYLIFGIEEAVKEAQNGGSGVVIYFRKEGRALGEVTKVSCSTTTHGRRSNNVGSIVRTKSLKLRQSSRYVDLGY